MKLIVCSKDIDTTLIKGDLISWHNDDGFEGKEVGLYNAVSNGRDSTEYLAATPFIILNLPLIAYEDIRPIIEDVISLGANDGEDGSVRKWKIDFSALELRGQGSVYANDGVSPTKARWRSVIPQGEIRRDTLNAYNEITRADIVIADILVLR